MVRLTKIYTRTGDDGSTGLGTGRRVQKDSLRVEAYGDVDETNAALGVAIVAGAASPEDSVERNIADVLRPIQHDLFDLGGDLCIPVEPREKPGERLRMVPSQTAGLERTIDEFNAHLGPLTSFVLPGGSPLAAALHMARTVCRRAERRLVALLRAERKATNPETLRYLNRLSDLLFVLARAANHQGLGDILWVPGANRSHSAPAKKPRTPRSRTKGPRP